MKIRPSLIITADDYGMSPSFNQGILELASARLITGISIMIKRQYIKRNELLAFGIPLGLHLELRTASSPEEIKDQIERFRERFGRLPAYLDGHQHKHLHSENLDWTIRAAKRYSLPVRSRFPVDRAILKENGLATPGNFVSWHPERLHILKKRLREARGYQISELVVHPGYRDVRCRYPYNQERVVELEFLRGSSFRAMIKPFRLMQYTDLINSPLS